MNSRNLQPDFQPNVHIPNSSGFENKIRQLLEIDDVLDRNLQMLLFKITCAQLCEKGTEIPSLITSYQLNLLSSSEEERYISDHLDEFIAKYEDKLSHLPIPILYRILNTHFSQPENQRKVIHEDRLSKFFFRCLDSHEGDQKRAILVSLFPFKEKKFEVYKKIVEKYEDVAHSNYISHLETKIITHISNNEKRMVYPLIFSVFLTVFSCLFFYQSLKQNKIDSQLMNQLITVISDTYDNKLQNMYLQMLNRLQDNNNINQKKIDEIAAQIKEVALQIKQISINQNEMNSLNEQMKENITTLGNQLDIIQNDNLNNISVINSMLNDVNESIFSKMMTFEEKYDIEPVLKLINGKNDLLNSFINLSADNL